MTPFYIYYSKGITMSENNVIGIDLNLIIQEKPRWFAKLLGKKSTTTTNLYRAVFHRIAAKVESFSDHIECGDFFIRNTPQTVQIIYVEDGVFWKATFAKSMIFTGHETNELCSRYNFDRYTVISCEKACNEGNNHVQ